MLGCVLLLGLSACSSSSEVEQEQIEKPVEVLYNEAADALDREEFKAAATAFQEVERQHPYSAWASHAQLMSAYASYKNEDYIEAELALERFIELHPGHENLDYAYYLKALTYYDQISDVRRDQGMTVDALKAFDELLRRFPESRYARDAVLKQDLTLDHLAGKEMEIGRYYLTRGHINAAINRFLAVVKNYETTSHVAEALHRLVEGYLTLGLKQEATRVASVLGYNYPGSVWYERSYALLDDEQRAQILESRGFWDKTIDSLLKPE